MQAGKRAAGSVMEAAANIAASAKSGLDKTKAVLEEKVERMSTGDPVEKDIATLRKEEKIDLAEIRKKEAYAWNAAASTGVGTQHYTDGGDIIPTHQTAIRFRSKLTTEYVTDVGTQHYTDGGDIIPTGQTSIRSNPKPTTEYVTEDVVGSHYPTMVVVGSPETNTGTGNGTHVTNPNPANLGGSEYHFQNQAGTGEILAVDPNITPNAPGFGSNYP